MDGVLLLDIVKQVESFMTKIKPDLIFTHHSGDINIDHDLTQRAVMTATRALPKSKPLRCLPVRCCHQQNLVLRTNDYSRIYTCV